MRRPKNFAELARKAFEVMIRRGWWPVFNPYDQRPDRSRPYWTVPHVGHWYITGARMIFDSERLKGQDGEILEACHTWSSAQNFSDPFTALVEADKWYMKNVDSRE